MTIKGSCLCGEVKYEINSSLHNVGHCYCSMCRKSHGAAFATYAALDPDKFQWISGADCVTEYISSSEWGVVSAGNAGLRSVRLKMGKSLI